MSITTQGFEHLYLETHNWGKSVAFWKALGFKATLRRTTTVANSRR